MSCRGCQTPKESRQYGKIWLSNDGYCSVCNVKYKDRPRIKPIFNFIMVKEGNYNHLDNTGRKLTESRIISYLNPNPSDYRKIKNKNKRNITEWL